VRSFALLKETVRRILTEGPTEFGAIYCDMDGVLVDFEAGAVELLTSILDGAADPMWIEGSKSMEKNIERVRRDLGEDWRPRVKSDLDVKGVRQIMISAISSAPGDFFESLPPLDDGINELWPFLNDLGVPVHILSAPIRGRVGTRSAEDGKRAWCARYLSPAPESIIIVDAVDKARWAMTDGNVNLLVDDKAKTIDAWNSLGGIGILHPPGDSASSISEIKRRLGRST
jgi:hypothetical protein